MSARSSLFLIIISVMSSASLIVVLELCHDMPAVVGEEEIEKWNQRATFWDSGTDTEGGGAEVFKPSMQKVQ